MNEDPKNEQQISIVEIYPDEVRPRTSVFPLSQRGEATKLARERAIEFLSLFGKAAAGAVVRVRVLALCPACDGTGEVPLDRAERHGYVVLRSAVCEGPSHEPRVLSDQIFRVGPK